jgi:hypothetical protein
MQARLQLRACELNWGCWAQATCMACSTCCGSHLVWGVWDWVRDWVLVVLDAGGLQGDRRQRQERLGLSRRRLAVVPSLKKQNALRSSGHSQMGCP